MKKMLFGALLCSVLALPTLAGAEQDKPPTIAVKYITEDVQQLKRDAEAAKAIQSKQYDASFGTISLEDVFILLKEASGLPIDINYPALELVGIDADSLVNYSVDKGSVADHLGAILDQVSADAFDDDKAGFAIQNGVIKVSTLRELAKKTEIRTYDVTPLLLEPFRPVGMLFSDDAFEDAVAVHAWLRGERRYPMTDFYMIGLYKQHLEKLKKEIDKLDPKGELPVEPEKQGLFGDGEGGLFGDDDDHASVNSHTDQLQQLIESSAGDPDQWLDEEFSINVQGGVFIIKATPQVHQQVSKLLDGLLASEIEKQANVMKDAHASRQVALANQKLLKGDAIGARDHVRQALWIMPNHVPANAMKQLLDGMGEKPKPVN